MTDMHNNKITICKEIYYEILHTSSTLAAHNFSLITSKDILKKLYNVSGYQLESIRECNLLPDFKPSKKHYKNKYYNFPSSNLNSRRFTDLINSPYINNYVIMDTIQGPSLNSKAILTFYWKNTNLTYLILIQENSPECVIYALDYIERTIGSAMFIQMFPAILTDMGQEFSDPNNMELSCIDKHISRTKIFYTNGNNAAKGAAENNHKYIRKVIPFGCNIEPYSQTDIELLMSHINSMPRKSLGFLTPFEASAMSFPTNFLTELHIECVDILDVNLTPWLLLNSLINYYF